MTYGERWATHAYQGRALIAEGAGCQGYGLWLAKIDGRLVLCDDSLSGHLKEVRPEDDEAEGLRRWRALMSCHLGVGVSDRPGKRGRKARHFAVSPRHFQFDSRQALAEHERLHG